MGDPMRMQSLRLHPLSPNLDRANSNQFGFCRRPDPVKWGLLDRAGVSPREDDIGPVRNATHASQCWRMVDLRLPCLAPTPSKFLDWDTLILMGVSMVRRGSAAVRLGANCGDAYSNLPYDSHQMSSYDGEFGPN